MSNHQKRLSVPNSWPVERKTETFTVAAGAGPHGGEGVPLLVVLRDVLNYVDSRREARYALRQDSVRINGVTVADETRPVGMFDILAFAEREEYYRVFPDEGGRLALTPIDQDAAGSKLGKVVGKREVPGGQTQLTLHDGETLLVGDDEYGTNDSIVVSNEGSEVVAHFPYAEDALVTAVHGGHAGEIGHIEAIQETPGSAPNNVLVAQDDGGFETIEEYVVVIDENFTRDTSSTDATEADAADAEPAAADEEEVATDVEAADAEPAAVDEEDVATDEEAGDAEPAAADEEDVAADEEAADAESAAVDEEDVATDEEAADAEPAVADEEDVATDEEAADAESAAADDEDVETEDDSTDGTAGGEDA